MVRLLIEFLINVLVGLLTIIGANYFLDTEYNIFWLNLVYALAGIVLWNTVIKSNKE